MIKFLFAMTVACVATIAMAQSGVHQTGFVQIRPDRVLNVDYYPAAPGQPTLVLLNGLTYDLTNFDPMMPHLLGNGYGILRYDPFGMGQTLVHYGAVTQPIPIESQVEDLHELLTVLNLNQVYLSGLSYGGGLALKFAATWPANVKEMILMSSFVSPRDNVPNPQDEIVQAEIKAARLANPLNPMTDDQLYDFYFRQLVYETYPTAEPEVLENPYKLEATFRLADGIRKFITDDFIQYWPQHSIHMMDGDQDQYIPAQMPLDFWNGLQPGQRLSKININNSTHKMPEVIPTFASAWINLIMSGNPALQEGNVFAGDALTGIVSGPALNMCLPADNSIIPN
jgi:pimeloyl-ACP methyl ester carboxylesterase